MSESHTLNRPGFGRLTATYLVGQACFGTMGAAVALGYFQFGWFEVDTLVAAAILLPILMLVLREMYTVEMWKRARVSKTDE